MKRPVKILISVIVFMFIFNVDMVRGQAGIDVVTFPSPDTVGKVTLETAIKNRRSSRDFTEKILTSSQIGQLLWAGQGITDEKTGYRAAPSAGAIHPMQIYVVLGEGLYVYDPKTHSMKKIVNRDVRNTLFTAAYRQEVIKKSPCTFIITAKYRLTEAKYRNRGKLFTTLEAGHIAQNIGLQAVTMGLGSVPIGSFDAKSVKRICKIKELEEAIYIISVGNPKQPLDLPTIAAPVVAKTVAKKSEPSVSKVLFIAAEKRFKDSELFDIQDILEVAGIHTYIASSKVGEIVGEDRNTVISDMTIAQIDVAEYDAFIFISGSGSNLYKDDRNVINLARRANAEGKVLAAISTTPSIFANAKIIKGKNIAAYPSERKNIRRAGGKWESQREVMVDGNIITAKESKDAGRLGRAVLRSLRMKKAK